MILNLTCLFLWIAWGENSAANFVATEVACLVAVAIYWYILDRNGARSIRELATSAATVLVLILTFAGVAEWLLTSSRAIPSLMTWIAVGAGGIAAATGLFSPSLRLAAPNLYVLGLCATILAILQAHLSAALALGPAVMALAAYSLGTQLVDHLWSRTCGVFTTSWFTVAQISLGCAIVLLSIPATFAVTPQIERCAGAVSILLVAATVAVLALRSPVNVAIRSENLVLVLLVLSISEIGWSSIDAKSPVPFLRGSIEVLASLGLIAFVAAVVVPRLSDLLNRWALAARRMSPALGLAGLVTLASVLLQELVIFDISAPRSPLSVAEIVLVALTMVGLVVTSLALALRAGADPFGLNGSGRKVYVYIAEVLAALLFLHLRLNAPTLIPPPEGLFGAIPVMALAFIGVGLAEFLRRRNLEILADPLHRTGVLLPALPLIAFWFAPATAVTSLSSYSLLWVSVGILYGSLALTRRSYIYVLGAALAMTGALWAMYGHEELGFLIHPQLWLVPLALIVLASEYVQRDHLSNELAASLRYGGLALLYLSSTADLVLASPGESAPLLLVLAALSVLGALAGILLRVRAYLFLGSGFLMLVVFRMIWHAAVEREQTWVWWACGIVLGVMVLTLFAILERRGQKVHEALDRFRQWR